MIGRVILAALLAGVAAGLIMGIIQHVRLTPFILQAETFETATPHSHGDATANQAEAHSHDDGEWAPHDGFERTFYTTATSAIAGAGFAAMLAAVSLISGLPITMRNGLIWGLCGFIAVTLAPAAGLPPELPGMPAADLMQRQIWWIVTIIATGAGLYLIATAKSLLPAIAAVVLIALPHIIGAPQPVAHETAVPAGLAAAFAANAIAANAVFWALIGLFLGIAFAKLKPESSLA
jgi:cobalt transporter subunit CbtA